MKTVQQLFAELLDKFGISVTLWCQEKEIFPKNTESGEIGRIQPRINVEIRIRQSEENRRLHPAFVLNRIADEKDQIEYRDISFFDAEANHEIWINQNGFAHWNGKTGNNVEIIIKTGENTFAIINVGLFFRKPLYSPATKVTKHNQDPEAPWTAYLHGYVPYEGIVGRGNDDEIHVLTKGFNPWNPIVEQGFFEHLFENLPITNSKEQILQPPVPPMQRIQNFLLISWWNPFRGDGYAQDYEGRPIKLHYSEAIGTNGLPFLGEAGELIIANKIEEQIHTKGRNKGKAYLVAKGFQMVEF